MSRNDYNAIKEIIKEIVGDTQQGNVLLKAIKGYFSQKENIKVVKHGYKIKAPVFKPFNQDIIGKFDEKAQAAMDKYTKKLAKENEKYRKKHGKNKTCSVNS
tara:strand:+ start:270 stop:575 length:306 start_codon:yes stop_codon:yes gene_type:complete